MATKDNSDVKVKVAELSTEVRFIAKAVTDLSISTKELADSVKKLVEGLQTDVHALQIWKAELTQRDRTNVHWLLKMETYIFAGIGGAAAWISKAFIVIPK